AELARQVSATGSAKEALAKRQANAAVGLLHLGQPEPVWPLFQHGNDPELRSQLIHRAYPLGVGAQTIIERLQSGTEISARRALILTLGEYPPDRLPTAARESLTSQLRQWHGEDPDGGIHSAVEWLFRTWKRDADLLPGADAPAGSADGRHWLVNRQ